MKGRKCLHFRHHACGAALPALTAAHAAAEYIREGAFGKFSEEARRP